MKIDKLVLYIYWAILLFIAVTWIFGLILFFINGAADSGTSRFIEYDFS